jgi:hypothetical protein
MWKSCRRGAVSTKRDKSPDSEDEAEIFRLVLGNLADRAAVRPEAMFCLADRSTPFILGIRCLGLDLSGAATEFRPAVTVLGAQSLIGDHCFAADSFSSAIG